MALNKHVVLTLGNKDMRTPALDSPGYTLSSRFALAKYLARGSKVHVLDRDVAIIEGVAFAGAHLGFGLHGHHPVLAHAFHAQFNDLRWGAYSDLFDDAAIRQRAMVLAKAKGIDGQVFSDEDASPVNSKFIVSLLVAQYERDLKWLRGAIADHARFPIVVVTHTSPDDSAALQADFRGQADFFRKTSARDYDCARYALNSNGGEGLRSQNPWAVLAWVYGQGDLSAAHLHPSGHALVSCGGNLSSTPYGPDVYSPFEVFELKRKLQARNLSQFMSTLSPDIRQLEALATAMVEIKRAGHKKAFRVDAIAALTNTVMDTLTGRLYDFISTQPLITEELRQLAFECLPKGSLARKLSCLKKLTACAQSPRRAMDQSPAYTRFLAKAKPVIEDVLNKHGLSGTFDPLHPAIAYCRHRWPLSVHVSVAGSPLPRSALDRVGALMDIEVDIERALGPLWASTGGRGKYMPAIAGSPLDVELLPPDGE